tara:strand:+ start:4186 stop:4746 length:561 start_codon:yes stop_codon:yes gene_type:complete
MKKLLYTFLTVSIIFSSCEEESTPAPASNNIFNTNLSIGDNYQGGIIFYLNANGGGLIAAPSDQSGNTEWGCMGTEISGADETGIEAGYQNTIDIESECNDIGTAADICANLDLNGYSDWFLPSLNELNQMFVFKNDIGGFANDYYWSSTETDALQATRLDFTHGQEDTGKAYKSNSHSVRAIRAF